MNKLHIKPYSAQYSTYGGNRKAITTLDFGQLTPLTCDELIDGDSFKVNLHNNMEIAPMVCKTYADIFYNQSAHFVPYTTLDKNWSQLRAQKQKHCGNALGKPLQFNLHSLICALFKRDAIKVASDKSTYIKFGRGVSADDALFEIPSITSVTPQSSDWIAATPITYNSSTAYSWKTYAQDAMKQHYPCADVCLAFKMSDCVDQSSGESGRDGRAYVIGLKFTKKGQFIKKIFDSLGYRLPMIPILGLKTSAFTTTDWKELVPTGALIPNYWLRTDARIDQNCSAYPILSYLKVIRDNFCMSVSKDEDILTNYLEKIYVRDSTYVHSSLIDEDELLNQLLSVSLQLYPDDVTRCIRNQYFANNPFYSVNASNTLTMVNYNEITQPATLFSVLHNKQQNSMSGGSSAKQTASLSTNLPSSDNPNDIVASSNSYTASKLVDVMHRFLLTQKYVGGSLASRLRAFLGITDPIDDAMQSITLGVNTIPLQISGNTIMSNTYNGTNIEEEVGQKFGTAYANGQTSYSFKNTRGYGMAIVLNWLSVKTAYMHRVARHTMKTEMYDYYDGKLDGQGFTQVKSQQEVDCNPYNPNSNRVFGCETLYDEYRDLNHDSVSGDITRVVGMESYLLPRKFDDIDSDSLLYAEFSAVRSVRHCTDEFNDIFITKSGYDPVILCSNMSLLANRKICDNQHAMALPTGELNVSIQNNLS